MKGSVAGKEQLRCPRDGLRCLDLIQIWQRREGWAKALRSGSDLAPKVLFFNPREERRMEKESRGGGRGWSCGKADN
jgi:hypothetical protein